MIIRAVYNMQINTSTQLKSIAVQTKHAAVMYVQQNGRKNQQHRLCGGVQPLRECVSVTLKKKKQDENSRCFVSPTCLDWWSNSGCFDSEWRFKSKETVGGNNAIVPYWLAATCCCDPSSKSVYRCLVNASREVETELWRDVNTPPVGTVS